MLPPPCLIVFTVYCGRYSVLGGLRTGRPLRSELNKFTFVSSDHKILRHLLTGQFTCSLANSNHFFMLRLDRNGTFLALLAFKLFLINIFLIVEVSTSNLYSFFKAEEVTNGSFFTCRTILRFNVSVIFDFFPRFSVLG